MESFLYFALGGIIKLVLRVLTRINQQDLQFINLLGICFLELAGTGSSSIFDIYITPVLQRADGCIYGPILSSQQTCEIDEAEKVRLTQ